MCVMCVGYTSCKCSVRGGEKKAGKPRSLKKLLGVRWVLGTRPRPSARAVTALNCWTISPAPEL